MSYNKNLILTAEIHELGILQPTNLINIIGCSNDIQILQLELMDFLLEIPSKTNNVKNSKLVITLYNENFLIYVCSTIKLCNIGFKEIEIVYSVRIGGKIKLQLDIIE